MAEATRRGNVSRPPSGGRTPRRTTQLMPYASELETRIAKKVTKAITEYNLVEDGDRVMVGLSGGKDSWALIQILEVLRRRAPIAFSIVAVNIDSGYDGYEYQKLK